MSPPMKTLRANLLIVAVFAAGIGGVQATENPLPKDMPKYGVDKPLPIPAIAKKTLDNGLVVWVLTRRGGNPKVDLVLAVRGGKAADPVDRPGMSDLLAGLLEEGTKTRSSVRIAEELQGLGATLGARAGVDGISLAAGGLASGTEPLTLLLADVARNASFPAAELELAKGNALQALKAAEAEPDYQAGRALDEVVYGDHPYARTRPTEASISATDRAGLVAAHRARFRPDRALLVIAGPVDEQRGFALAQKAFGDWKASASDRRYRADCARPAAAARADRTRRQRAVAVRSGVRIRCRQRRRDPAAIANAVAGGDFSSRLSQVLREEKGYTYGAYSAFGTNRSGGAFSAEADVRNEVTGAALREFHAQLQSLVDKPVGDAELERAKRATAGRYLFRNQLQGAVTASLANNWLLGRPPGYLGEFVGKTNVVSAAQVQAIAKKYFDPKKLSVVIVGDKAVADQLKEFGEFSSQVK